ncbi:hypothetical protein [Burkholderia pseudomallei]|uniref:hypothetical protein n=1 Tax=Burkholderia pseudomallei TaxID=28450 RepID=UPI000F29DE51|nr:hypothetical protein [Burkholderia pseudomallei]MWA21184.1 hypothetical protein [Burkholderia pseudomallei]MWA27780.1 hypothetical protein [Burkholderia pseudomallei]VCN33766.1 Uncharacterised protein [Burkholderia pseudomallei]VCN62305.1 Uncharacterised protein [Burkholderia pseudomallei]
MAKLLDDPIEADDISRYLSAQDDFALELRSVKQAHQCGFQVRHGGTYSDPATQKPRQYDIRALLSKNGCQVYLAIECKSLRKNFPLVVSRIPRADGEAFHQLVASVPNRIPPLEVRRVVKSNLYRAGDPVGKSTTQVGRTNSSNGEWTANDGDTHDKWAQALASIDQLVKRAAPAPAAQAAALEKSAMLPVLVVSNETLWCIDYDDHGNICAAPRRTDETTLFVGRDYNAHGQLFTISHLHICTEIGLCQLLQAVAGNSDWWASMFSA